MLSHHGQKRRVNIAQVHPSPAELEFILIQFVVPGDLLGHLPKTLTWERNLVVAPAFEEPERAHEIVIPHFVPELDLLHHALRRSEHLERVVKQLGWHVAKSIDDS